MPDPRTPRKEARFPRPQKRPLFWMFKTPERMKSNLFFYGIYHQSDLGALC